MRIPKLCGIKRPSVDEHRVLGETESGKQGIDPLCRRDVFGQRCVGALPVSEYDASIGALCHGIDTYIRQTVGQARQVKVCDLALPKPPLSPGRTMLALEGLHAIGLLQKLE